MTKQFLFFVLSYYFIWKGVCDFNRGLEVIPERADVDYVNAKYAENAKLSVRRYSRRSKYVVNCGITIKHTWNNNISVHAIFYEYLHNEYRRSFVEMHFKLCDFVNNDRLIGYHIRMAGLVCPLPPGTYFFTNMTFSQDGFTYLWPFERGKAEMSAVLEPKGEKLAASYIIFTVKQKDSYRNDKRN